MSPLFRILIALLIGVALLGLSDVAVAQQTESRVELERAAQVYDSEVVSFQLVLQEYAELTERIETLKSSARVFWDAAELDALLREQEEAAGALGALDSDIQHLRDAVESASEALVDDLRVEVRALEARLTSASPLERARIAQEMNAFTREIGELDSPLPEYSPVPIEAITALATDSPAEIYAATDELFDHEARLERELEEVRERLEDAQASARVLRTESEFSSIEDLLEDDGSRRLGSRGESSERGGTPMASPTTDGAGQDDFGEAAEEPTANRDEGGFDADSPSGAPESSDDAAAPDFDGPPESGQDGGPLAGGDALVDFGASPLESEPSEASSVLVQTVGEEPARIDSPGRNRSRSRSNVDVLSDREEALSAELEAVRAERERLLERARVLEGL
jgi:predicted  nucleic acid-binding Zn-ribbon protein